MKLDRVRHRRYQRQRSDEPGVGPARHRNILDDHPPPSPARRSRRHQRPLPPAPRPRSRHSQTRRCRRASAWRRTRPGKPPSTDETIGGLADSRVLHRAAKSGGIASPASFAGGGLQSLRNAPTKPFVTCVRGVVTGFGNRQVELAGAVPFGSALHRPKRQSRLVASTVPHKHQAPRRASLRSKEQAPTPRPSVRAGLEALAQNVGKTNRLEHGGQASVTSLHHDSRRVPPERYAKAIQLLFDFLLDRLGQRERAATRPRKPAG